MNSTSPLIDFQKKFTSIGLSELNEKAKMLDRSENKYILNLDKIKELQEDLAKEFEILEINNTRNFGYESIYFDDAEHICYYQHHQKKRQRFKARTRKYIGADLYFFEIKFKGIRGKTKKKRFQCEENEHGVFTKEGKKLAKKHFKKIYKKKFKVDLVPSNGVFYNRITLVAKAGNERLTIDYGLTFFDPQNSKNKVIVPEDFIIVETKSTNGRGIADKIFRKYKLRSRGCSKFCLSKIFLKQVNKYNVFLPLLKRYFSY